MSSQTNPIAARQNPAPRNSEEKQQRLMRVALGLLCSALLIVMLKNWDFWTSMISPETVATQTAAPDATPGAEPVKTARPATSVARSRDKKSVKALSVPQPSLGPVITATNRTVLPPLEIQVVSGNRHQNVHTSNRSIQVDLSQSSGANLPSTGDGITSNAGERIPLSTDGSPSNPAPDNGSLIAHKVQPDFPMLAKQMKIQGAVVLEALIGRGGDIQHLRVLTGPSILALAAREAVKQWHFKPYLAGGKPVETEARITVNFTISAD